MRHEQCCERCPRSHGYASPQMGFEGVTYTPPPLAKTAQPAAKAAEKEAVQLDNPLEGLFELPVPKTLRDAAASISDAGSIASSVKRGTTLANSKAGSPTRALDAEGCASGNEQKKLRLALALHPTRAHTHAAAAITVCPLTAVRTTSLSAMARLCSTPAIRSTVNSILRSASSTRTCPR